MARRTALFLASLVLVAVAGPAFAQESSEPAGPVVVADVRGPLDQRVLDFLVEALETRDAQLVVLKLDTPGLSSGDPSRLVATVVEDRVPLALWVGPSGAVGFGAVVADLAKRADAVGAAPGASVGYFFGSSPGSGPCGWGDDGPCPDHAAVAITEDGPAVARFTDVTPTIGQFIVGLDGRTATTAGGIVTLETATTTVTDAGLEVIVPSVEVRFLKPGLFTRFLRLASRPEAAFFFLIAGLAAAAFEFYAAGVGVTAAVASLALLLAGYGMATLPMNWWSVGLTLVGMILWTADVQRNQVRLLSVVGAAALVWGGVTFTATGPQYPPRWWVVILAVAGIGLFYAFALTTVVRARFSTRTIGREQLIGRRGTAETGFDPEGVVVLDGARWRARAHRAAGLEPGDPIEVLEVKGFLLEVGPPDSD